MSDRVSCVLPDAPILKQKSHATTNCAGLEWTEGLRCEMLLGHLLAFPARDGTGFGESAQSIISFLSQIVVFDCSENDEQILMIPGNTFESEAIPRAVEVFSQSVFPISDCHLRIVYIFK